MKVIIAPHPDDEIIGCFTLMEKYDVGKVIFCSFENREVEARSSADAFGFEPVFIDDLDLLIAIVNNGDEVYIPSRHDHHPFHKQVNAASYRITKDIQRIFYTVSKNVKGMIILDSVSVFEKKKQLDILYPSQKHLWESDQKYLIFEKYITRDHELWASVSWRMENLHAWATCPDNHPESHLRNSHRHEFHIKVMVEQLHNDRDVEYLLLKRLLKDQYRDHCPVLYNLSCEQMAERIFLYVKRQYPDRDVRVEVFEDGENGAVLQ